MAMTKPLDPRHDAALVHIAILGAGFAGLGMAMRLRAAGIRSFTIFERGDDVGGTWRDNTYPGCACDVPSHLYSFSFAPKHDWSRRYASQPEIQDYLTACRDDHDLRRHVRCGTAIEEMRYDPRARVWRLRTSDGDEVVAHVVVNATGPLSKPSLPRLPGLESFEGTLFHSARWRHDHDLAGERVAVVGTGASAIQIVPAIAAKAGRLHVFQRTAPWIVPRHDRPFGRLARAIFRRVPGARRAYRAWLYLRHEARALAFLGRRPLAGLVARAARAHLARQVADPALRARLTPDTELGCKRVLISNDWYPALQRPNVELVTDAIAEVRPRSLVTRDGREIEVDTLILATGFDATSFLSPMKVYGRSGVELSDAWKDGAATHLGITVAGYPNLFLLVGPNTGLGHNSIVFMIEAQVRYVVQAIQHLLRENPAPLALRVEAQARSYRDVQERMADTVWTTGCRSWYLSESGRNDTLWPGFSFDYWRRTRRFEPTLYEGR